MANVNKWIGVGNCCADAETKALPSGNYVTNITVACNDKYKDKKTGQAVEKTEFVRIVFFNRLAEIAGEYLKKGSQVYVEGALRTRKWQDQSGNDRYTTEIVGSEMQMLGGRQGGGGGMGGDAGYDQSYAPQAPSQAAPQQQYAAPQQQAAPAARPQAAPAPHPSTPDNFDDDIPF